jgi:phosphoribosyl 1,2-cyclic phosphodiesterase
MRFSLLGSGSSGNAILIVNGASKVLIDDGLSFKQLSLRTTELGETLEGLKAVFVTHEHSDHVGGVGTLTRKLDVPVYMTPGTHDSLPKSVGRIPRVEEFDAGDTICVDGVAVTSYSVSHDAADPVSYIVESDTAKLGMAADLGHSTNLVRTKLAGCHGLILESNYCPDMLRVGPYPPMIQQRIRSRQGHLSNAAMCSLLSDLLHDALKAVVLVHISEENNCPDLARRMATQVVDGRPVSIYVAERTRPTPMIDVTP